MLAVIYKVRLHPGQDETYQECWKYISCYFVEHRGAIGSSLHRSEEGLWMIYSKWPDRETQECSWSFEAKKKLPYDVLKQVERMQACVFEKEESLYFEILAESF